MFKKPQKNEEFISDDISIIEALSRAEQARIAAESRARQSEIWLKNTLDKIHENDKFWREHLK